MTAFTEKTREDKPLRTARQWPRTILKALRDDRWWWLLNLSLGAAMAASTWFVPGPDLGRFANAALIGLAVFMAGQIIVGTFRTAYDGQPMPPANFFAPLRTAVLVAGFLPIVPSTFGAIAAWQAVGLWLRSHGLG